MATTELGIYFPTEGTNADFVSIFSTLANSVNDAISQFTYDSGWIAVSQNEMSNSWEPYNSTGSHVRYRKIGKITYLDGIIRYGTGNDVFTLPEGFRPKGVWPNFAAPITSTGTSSNNNARVRVTTAGVVQAYVATQSLRDSGVGLSAVAFVSE